MTEDEKVPSSDSKEYIKAYGEYWDKFQPEEPPTSTCDDFRAGFKAGYKSVQNEVEYLKAQNKGFQAQYNDCDKLVNGLREEIEELNKQIDRLEEVEVRLVESIMEKEGE